MPVSEHSALQQQLDTLSEQWPANAQPIALQTAKALLQRAALERESVASRLVERARHCLDAVGSPTANERPVPDQSTDLTALVSALRHDAVQAQAPVLSKLEKQIEEQNLKLLGEKPATETVTETREPEADGLRAARKFERTRQRHAKRKAVAIALERRPENPGPLNPHMLAVKILSELQDVSPDYLERYVSFVDALVSLDAGIKSWNKKSATQKKR